MSETVPHHVLAARPESAPTAAATAGDPPASAPRAVAADRRLPEARLYRPVVRRPMALIHVIDDGRDGGEVVRVRGDRFVIGRTEGDLRIPHDLAMSPRHVVLERVGGDAWHLADAGTSDGTFVRVLGARLRDGMVVRIGITTLLFREIGTSESWLVEVAASGRRHHECHGAVTSIGRVGCGCAIGLADPFVSPLHAEIHRGQRGWRIDNAGLNGLWVRIDSPVRLTGPAQFQCGEQRFVFEPLAG